MANEQTNQPNRADDYRKAAEKFAKDVSHYTSTDGQIAVSLVSSTLALWAIAAELAEGNSRDREAEIRAKNAEEFVAGIQAELARQGVIVPGGMANVKPPRGR